MRLVDAVTGERIRLSDELEPARLQEAVARQTAEARAAEEAAARQAAEAKAVEEAAARRAAEERIRVLEAELERLRKSS